LNAENITVEAAKQACILGEGKKTAKKPSIPSMLRLILTIEY